LAVVADQVELAFRGAGSEITGYEDVALAAEIPIGVGFAADACLASGELFFFAAETIGIRPEHLRIAQWDILEFSRSAKHPALKWPDDYWPKTDVPPSPAAWTNSVRKFRADLKAMAKLIADKKSDLFTPLPHGDGQTLLREALLLADHNAYHVGQLVLVRRLLGNWKS